MNNQLDATVAERDALEAQLSRANDALTNLHGRIGTSHDQIRRELVGIESAFGDVPAPAPVVADASDETASDDGRVDEMLRNIGSAVPTADVDDATVVDAPIDAATVAEAFESPDVSTLGRTAPDFSSPEIEAPEIEAPDLGGVDDLDVPSFGDAVDLATEGFSSSDIDTDSGDDEDFFDGEGLELDPSTLGGRTIGDMFGGDENVSASDIEMPTSDVDNQMNGNGIADAQPVLDQPAVDDGEVSTAGRRQLPFSVGLDEAAFAQHVVASPDIVLLIDGDGAAGLGWPHLDVATRRGALVDYLGTLTADTGAAADVVFARPVGDEEALPVSRAVRVRIADAAVADSPIFASIINGYPEEWPIAIVTNEPALVAQAETLEVSVLSNDQLLDLFLDLNSEG